MRKAGTLLRYRHYRAASLRERPKKETKKNIAEAIELHLSALARYGICLSHRPGMKGTFVAVGI